jgi:hypothetical protein
VTFGELLRIKANSRLTIGIDFGRTKPTDLFLMKSNGWIIKNHVGAGVQVYQRQDGSVWYNNTVTSE